MKSPSVFLFRNRSSWKEIRDWFLAGHVAGFPAEFSYALSEVPSRRPANDPFRLFRIKNRPANKPILYFAGSLQIIERFARIPLHLSKNCIFTGPPHFVTILLPARPLAVSLGMSQSGKVAFRVPSERLLRDFLMYLGEPLSGTSLNISGKPPIRTPEEIRLVFPDLPVVDGGEKPGYPVSPILDLTTVDRRILRGSWPSILRAFR